ncbi:MAG: methylmalonyl-CoA mutase [Deltaproteobacteria bacterium CG12_big_fil_rev_8_21_14_0_65_43_10]|nr:MAG: methylmalonyl-CoA mutase [Deltaproteobacteria bacterium CG2_30_43_15]PIQ46592.1 MAG: methylmalonyl-CoA mutase [Deltaproteobacteria bacterium CG12_big_fil_rev_8_21_14_0_65_43_10]PIU86064.1 MAG: methylmalonyl-CoA mutase [Deltaproteobacteria bacterium CG06_land_8_20_14_3_00_44_19]PIX25928.1 MAG: methylmalonyl-CoA mutase [Deltaproteobacteria bacterium CG_4_8_14_3_um_filter_43_13]PIZ20388.1 MAG: methylmalonyl-CoA mutase [Deltaproteobacteria bacterium CG_4_10_14_0_8_um_filter_43_12]
MSERDVPIRVLVAKPGLDGHDRGAKVVVKALRDAGMEVIYTGLHQNVDQIVATAIQEDVDVIGLSILNGVHIPISKKLLKKLKEKGVEDKTIIVGGLIPTEEDFEKLKEIGIDGVFPTSTPFDTIVAFIKEKVG